MALLLTPLMGKPASDYTWEVEPTPGAPYFSGLKMIESQAPIIFIQLRPKEHLEIVAGTRPGMTFFCQKALATSGCHIPIRSHSARGAGGMGIEIEDTGVDLKIDQPIPVSWSNAVFLLNPDTWGWICEEVEAPEGSLVPSTSRLSDSLTKKAPASRLPPPKGR
jgi:hypothetical protein